MYVAQQKKNDEFGNWNDSIYEVLNEEIIQLRKEGYKVQVSGDMNAWVGAGVKGIKNNYTRINRNGERLMTFLDTSGMVIVNGLACCTGKFTRHGHRSASILYQCPIPQTRPR